MDPERMLSAMDALRSSNVPGPYLDAIVGGVARHIRFRLGELSAGDGWKPTEPLPHVSALAARLLRHLTQFCGDWLREYTVCEGTLACAWTMESEASAEELTALLERLQQSEDPQPSASGGASFVARNSTRGQAAEAATILVGRLAEAGRSAPQRLIELLERFSSDLAEGVRLSVLKHLPGLTRHRPDLGWLNAELAIRGASLESWVVGEQVLYQNYFHHFDRVQPFLQRIAAAGYDPGGEAYGRISALSGLAGHLSLDDLIDTLPDGPVSVWKGVADVLCTNLPLPACAQGLLRLIRRPSMPREAWSVVVSHLESEQGRYVPREVVRVLIAGTFADDRAPWRLGALVKWIHHHARHTPTEMLPFLEGLVDLIQQGTLRRRFIAADELVVTLSQLLREADESDIPEFIRRVVDLQDRYLQLGIKGIDDLLDAASRG